MDLTLNLQAAVFSAAGAAGIGADMAAVPEDGMSFSQILAQTGDSAQAGEAVSSDNTVDQSGNAEDAADTTVPAEDAASGETEAEEDTIYVPKTSLETIMSIINNADDGIKKGMRLLLETMIKALMGDSSKDKKTDLFSMFYGSSSGTGLFDDDTFLLGTEFMYQMGNAMDMDLAGGADEDDIMDVLDRLLGGVFHDEDDDEENDENAAADILAAMLSPEVQTEISVFTGADEGASAVEITAELFKAPKEAIREEEPDIVPKMERLYEEFRVEIEVKPVPEEDIQETVNDIRNLMAAERPVLKINDAAEQVRLIGGSKIAETAADDDTEEEIIPQPELAAIDVRNTVPESSTTEVKASELDVPAARSVENQITERISEEFLEMKDDSGTKELVIVLRPENLGQVAVKLVKESGTVSVMLSAQYEEVGKLMTERAAALGDSLSNRNVEVKDIEVVDPSNAAEQMGLNFTNQGFSFGRGQEYSSDDGKNSYRGIDGIDETEETEQEINVIREARLWQTA